MTTDTETALDGLGLTKEESRTILERAAVRMLPRDALVLQNGNRSEYLYIILEGQVKTFVTDSYGSETVISRQGPGEYFYKISLSTYLLAFERLMHRQNIDTRTRRARGAA